jgi:glycosyltransferase involved in cell wall biosynthesis
MRVVHVASGDAWGGAERVLALLAPMLAAQPGFSVETLLFNEGRLAERLRASGVMVTIIPESGRSFARLVLAVRRWLASRKPDIVHAHRYKEIVTIALALAPRRRGFVATVHGLEPLAQLRHRRGVVIWGALVLGCLAGATIAAVSGELTRRLRRLFGHRRVANIANPIPPPGPVAEIPNLRRQLGWNDARPLVGFVGRLEHVKGPDIFVDVAHRCQLDAGFVVVGSGSLVHELVALAEAGPRDRVAFLGEVPDATPYLQQLDVLALTSRHEGLPLVVLEAAAAGVPVVAFDVGGVREALEHGGGAASLVPAADTRAFCRALEEMLRDRMRARREAAAWATSVRARFSLEAVTHAYVDLYHRAAGPGG